MSPSAKAVPGKRLSTMISASSRLPIRFAVFMHTPPHSLFSHLNILCINIISNPSIRHNCAKWANLPVIFWQGSLTHVMECVGFRTQGACENRNRGRTPIRGVRPREDMLLFFLIVSSGKPHGTAQRRNRRRRRLLAASSARLRATRRGTPCSMQKL